MKHVGISKAGLVLCASPGVLHIECGGSTWGCVCADLCCKVPPEKALWQCSGWASYGRVNLLEATVKLHCLFCNLVWKKAHAVRSGARF